MPVLDSMTASVTYDGGFSWALNLAVNEHLALNLSLPSKGAGRSRSRCIQIPQRSKKVTDISVLLADSSEGFVDQGLHDG